MALSFSLNFFTGGPSSLHVTLACERCCITNGFTKVCMGCQRFFLKRRENVMFSNKIDLPYGLVVFFVVCPRLRPFWSVFGELACFWCSTAKIKTAQRFQECPGVSVARGEEFCWKITPGLNSSTNSKQRCCSSMSIHSIRNSSHRSFTSVAFISCSIGFPISN